MVIFQSFHYHVRLLEGIFYSFHVSLCILVSGMSHRWRRRRSWWHLPSVWHIWALSQCWEMRSLPLKLFSKHGRNWRISKIWIWTSRSLKILINYLIYGSGYNKRRFSEKSSTVVGRDSTSWVNSNAKQQSIDPSGRSSFEFNQPWRWGVVCGHASNVKVRMRSKNQLVFQYKFTFSFTNDHLTIQPIEYQNTFRPS